MKKIIMSVICLTVISLSSSASSSIFDEPVSTKSDVESLFDCVTGVIDKGMRLRSVRIAGYIQEVQRTCSQELDTVNPNRSKISKKYLAAHTTSQMLLHKLMKP